VGLFKKAEVTSAFLKMGLMGFAGSGKTYTATETAIGLVLLMRERGITQGAKPMFFLDTETGSDWVLPRVEAAGIELFTAKTRAFSDLLQAVREAEATSSLLLVDSVTHFWKELTDAYMKKKGRTRLQFDDWAYLKQEWSKFTDLFINSNLHIIIAGRAGFEYDYFEDDAGKKQLEKTGIKMKAEGEMGYEPSLLVLMERAMDVAEKRTWRTATVLKDRSTLLDGKEFTNPKFANFLPHIELLNLGGRQLGVDTSRNSEATIQADKRDRNPVQRRIVIDEIGDLMTLHIPGMAAADKQRKIQLIRKHFNNAAWAEIEEVMPLFELRAGYDGLHRELEGKPSRYAVSAPIPLAADTAPIDDISHVLDAPAPKPLSLKEKLLADIPSNTTIVDCARWGIAVAKMDGLTPLDREEIETALTLHRHKLMKAVAA